MKFLLGAATAVSILVALNLSETPIAALVDSQAPLKFELYKDASQEFRWRLKAANGKIVGMSDEGYRSKDACRDGIDLIKAGASKASVEDQTLE